MNDDQIGERIPAPMIDREEWVLGVLILAGIGLVCVMVVLFAFVAGVAFGLFELGRELAGG